MLAKTICNNLLKLNSFSKTNPVNNTIKIISPLNTTNFFNSIHTTSYNLDLSKSENKTDEMEFQKDVSSGIRNLEKLGIIKPYMSWPQYNRIVYPPSNDGIPMKNPVFFLIFYIEH